MLGAATNRLISALVYFNPGAVMLLSALSSTFVRWVAIVIEEMIFLAVDLIDENTDLSCSNIISSFRVQWHPNKFSTYPLLLHLQRYPAYSTYPRLVAIMGTVHYWFTPHNYLPKFDEILNILKLDFCQYDITNV